MIEKWELYEKENILEKGDAPNFAYLMGAAIMLDTKNL
jgi:hypothetical protein